MPLLMCPNCQSGMKELNRENVMIDMCPQCQGVWLDRGELQKLLEISRADEQQYREPASAQQVHRMPAQHHAPHHDPYRRHHDDDDYRHGYRKKSRMESIFDIFD